MGWGSDEGTLLVKGGPGEEVKMEEDPA